MNQVVEIGALRILRFADQGPALRVAADANGFLSEAFSCDADLLAIPVERLGPDFLILGTGLAGEVLQKFVNYRLKCTIIGDISGSLAASRALRDFVRETNKGNAIWFTPDFDQLRARLEDGRTG